MDRNIVDEFQISSGTAKACVGSMINQRIVRRRGSRDGEIQNGCMWSMWTALKEVCSLRA